MLREKAGWYLRQGVLVVWLVLPESREVVVMRADGSESRHGSDSQLPSEQQLPGLTPEVARFFAQLDGS